MFVRRIWAKVFDQETLERYFTFKMINMTGLMVFNVVLGSQKIGIKEDSSLGYTQFIGYRCGTGFAYYIYDFKNEKAFDVLEKPITFMDSSWLHEKKRSKLSDIDILFSQFYGTYNFHNSTFDELESRNIKMKTLYLKTFCE